MIERAVLLVDSSKNISPMLSSVFFSTCHTNSRTNCDLPSPEPAVIVTSSSRIPYDSLLSPLNG